MILSFFWKMMNSEYTCLLQFNSMRRAITASRRFHVGAYVRPSGFYVHHWTFGEFLPVFFFADSTYWILDWGDFYLEAPPPGTIWVRVGDDALLIDQFSLPKDEMH